MKNILYYAQQVKSLERHQVCNYRLLKTNLSLHYEHGRSIQPGRQGGQVV